MLCSKTQAAIALLQAITMYMPASAQHMMSQKPPKNVDLRCMSCVAVSFVVVQSRLARAESKRRSALDPAVCGDEGRDFGSELAKHRGSEPIIERSGIYQRVDDLPPEGAAVVARFIVITCDQL